MLTVNRVQKLFDSLNAAPWSLPWDWPQHWDALFPGALDVTGPADGARPRVWSTEEGVILEADLPGRKLEDIDVSVEQNLLTIRCDAPLYGDEQDCRFRIRERSDGKTTMQFRMPFPMQPEQVEVVYVDGVLRISAARPEEEKPRKVTVRQG